MATGARDLQWKREALEKAAVATGRERRAKVVVETSEAKSMRGKLLVRGDR
jgi:hypothetical protein